MMGRTFLAAIAFLILSVGVLSTGTRFPQVRRNTTLRHTSQSGRMAEHCGSELAPIPLEESRPAPITPVPEVSQRDSIGEFVVPIYSGVAQARGLRAPPLL